MKSLDLYDINKYKDPSTIEFFYCADYEKAEEIVNSYIIEFGEPIEVNYGLDGDWDSNHDLFYSCGVFNDDCESWGQSYWAKPKLQFIYDDKEMVVECFTKKPKL